MKHTILIVDDDALILNTLKDRFNNWQFDVYTAKTASEAKELLAKFEPEVIILDVLLTEADGSTGVLDFLKTRPELARATDIALTNLEKPELKQMLMEQGVKEYLIKGSLNLDELYQKVLAYLEPESK